MKNYFGYLLSTLTVVGVAAASLAGCSSSSEPVDGSSADDLRVKPTGTETWASLTVQLPTGSCQPGGSCSRPLGATASLLVDNASVALGAKTRLKPGDHTLTVNGVGTQVTLTAGQTRTLTLPVAHRKCQAAGLPTVSQTDFGKSVALTNAACPSAAALSTNNQSGRPTVRLHWNDWNCPAGNIAGTLTPQTQAGDCAALGTNQIYSVSINGACTNLTGSPTNGIPPQTACTRYLASDYAWTLAGINTNAQIADTDLAFVPGTYAINVSTGTGTTSQTFTLAEGATSEVAVSLPVIGTVPTTFKANITFASARELPDALVASIVSSCSGDRSYSLQAGTTTTLALKAFQASSCIYTLNAGGRSVALDQAQSNDITLNRLDMDNVVVTREDASTYTVVGTYELYFGGNRVVGPFNTNSGVDVLPGSYELVTKFTTADGPQTQRQTIQL